MVSASHDERTITLTGPTGHCCDGKYLRRPPNDKTLEAGNVLRGSDSSAKYGGGKEERSHEGFEVKQHFC